MSTKAEKLALTPDLIDLRTRILAGEEPPKAELISAIRALREGRKSLVENREAKRQTTALKKNAKAEVDLDALFSSLGE
jgi:hypothetical protein